MSVCSNNTSQPNNPLMQNHMCLLYGYWQGNSSINGPPIVLLWPGLPSGGSSSLNGALPMEDPAIQFVDSMVFRGEVAPSSLFAAAPGTKPLTWGAFLSNLAAGNTCKFKGIVMYQKWIICAVQRNKEHALMAVLMTKWTISAELIKISNN